MRVNYVLENKAFIEFAADNKVTPNERLLWYALLHVFNDHAKGSEWPDDFIVISNRRLLALVPFSEDSMEKSRNNLHKRGLIKYKPGRRNTQNPMYAMCYFTPNEAPCYPQNTGNMGGNAGGNTAGNTEANTGGSVGGNRWSNTGGNKVGNRGVNSADIIRKPNGKPNPNVNINVNQTGGNAHAQPFDESPGFLPWEDVR